MPIKDQQRFLEILAVVITGLGKFIFMDIFQWRFAYITTACLFWIVYVFYRYRKNNKVIAYWGFTKEHFTSTFLELLPWAILCALTSVFIGYQLGTSVLNWTIIPIMILYPVWGIIQQFLIVGLIARNLQDMQKYKVSTPLIVLLTTLVFSVVHYPFMLLVLATFLLAIVYTLLYLKGRNLIVLGIYHGWLGALFFYTILGRDAWLDVFGRI